MINRAIHYRFWFTLTVGGVLLLAIPHVAGPYYLDLMTRLLLLGLVALSLDLVVGGMGLISLGHAALFGMGGYVLGFWHLVGNREFLWLYGVLAVALAAVIALLFGWAATRTRGPAFLMITLAIGQVLYYAFLEIPALQGADGIVIPVSLVQAIGSPAPSPVSDRWILYYVALALTGISIVFLAHLLRSPFGQMLLAIRDNEARVRGLGVVSDSYKLAGFALSGAIAGTAGFLTALHDGFVSPDHLSWHASGQVLIAVVLGGVGTLYGPVVAAVAIGLYLDVLQDLTPYWRIIYGATILVAVIRFPDGIVTIFSRDQERSMAFMRLPARSAARAKRKA